MFISSSSTQRYFKLVQYYVVNPPSHGEKHHIIPKSLGGDDSVTNKTLVPSRVHYLLHWLLTRMMISSQHKKKMIYAFWAMMNPQSKRESNFIKSSRQYKKMRDYIREEMINNNPMHNPEISILFKGRKRPAQTVVVNRLNDKRWGNHQSLEDVTCEQCGATFSSRKTLKSRFCNRSCSALFLQEILRKNREEEKQLNPVIKKIRGAWKIGTKDINGSTNGKKGAAKQSAKVTGRRIVVGEDGVRRWSYPEKIDVQRF